LDNITSPPALPTREGAEESDIFNFYKKYTSIQNLASLAPSLVGRAGGEVLKNH